MTNVELVFRNVVLPTKHVRAQMQRNELPEFEMRHRMELALEYGSVTVSTMARHLGISRTTVSNYLHGRTQPRRSDLIAWALRCGVPFDWLVGVDSDHVLDEEATPAPRAQAEAKAKAQPKQNRSRSRSA